MTNPIKIEMAANKLPACFAAYDILYCGDKQITDLPLIERKERLFDVMTESSRLALSRHIESTGIAFFELAKQQGLEGIVAKRKDSRYYFGKRTKDWLKMKALLDDDFVVCGYYGKSVIIGSYLDEKIVEQGHISLGVSSADYRIISSAKRVSKADYYSDFPEFDNAVWIEPELVCVVQFMERTKNGGLRQPVFKGLREDKAAAECKL